MSSLHTGIPGLSQLDMYDREDFTVELEKERRIQTAIKVLNDHPDRSIRSVAADYSLTYNTLRNRFKGVTKPRHLAFQHLQRLTPAQERAIVRHIKEQDDFGYPATRNYVLEVASNLLPHNSDPLGANWHEGFEERNPDIRPILSCALDRQRALTNTETGYKAYWQNLISIIVKYNIPPENIWNFDEKGFIIGKCGRYIIYCRIDRQNPTWLAQNGNRESVTDGETISAAGKSIPPYIITRGKIHTVAKFRYINAESDVLEGASFANAPEGVMHAVISIDYLKSHFEPLTRPFMKTAAQGGSDHRLLLWDSHTSHTTLDVRYFGVNNLIHLCTFPSHQTHKLQPLDVAIFSPLALAYKILLEKWNRKNPYAAMGKAEFFLLLSRAREIALTEENIRSAFAATGIFPLSEEKIMSLLDRQLDAPSSNPLLDTPRRPGNSHQSKTARFRTPEPLRTYDSQVYHTPGDAFQALDLQMVAEDPTATVEDLRIVCRKLGKGAGRGFADSAINRALNEGLRASVKQKAEKKDTHHLSTSTVLTHGAAIALEEVRQSRIQKKDTKQRRNTAKKEAKRMQMTLEEYIVWYNAEKARRPPRILRTQLDQAGCIEHIPMSDSDDEWQLPTPPSSPNPAQKQRIARQRAGVNGLADVVLDDADLNLLFGDLQVAGGRPESSASAVAPPSLSHQAVSKSVSITSANPPSGTARSPEKRLPYIPIPLPQALAKDAARIPPTSPQASPGKAPQPGLTAPNERLELQGNPIPCPVGSDLPKRRLLRSRRTESADSEGTGAKTAEEIVCTEMKHLMVARRTRAGSRRENESGDGKRPGARSGLRSRQAVAVQTGVRGGKVDKLVIVLKVPGDKLEEIWGGKRKKRRSRC